MTIQPSAALIDEVLDHAIAEDLGAEGDVTSAAIFAESDAACAIIKSKDIGILSGCFLLTPLFSKIDPWIRVTQCTIDGSPLGKGTLIARLEGPIRGILAGERVALNFLQRLSGVATLTNHFVKAIAHTDARLLDTRKTTPNLRAMEKFAVAHGGGENHRFGLYDMILIKDTHVRAAGGVGNAIRRVKQSAAAGRGIKIEAEVQSIEEFMEALKERPDRIMLDNMTVEVMQRCVDLRNDSGQQTELEASGNVTLDTVKAIAETGVDFISVGSITHSAKALDIHLVIV